MTAEKTQPNVHEEWSADDLRLALEQLERWAGRRVGPLFARPEAAPPVHVFAELTQAARQQALLGSEDALLWGRLPPAWSGLALERLAVLAPAFAWHLHQHALGEYLQRRAGHDTIPGGLVVTQGDAGLAAGALARWLTGRDARPDDAPQLQRWFDPERPRMLVSDAAWTGAWWPALGRQGRPGWTWLPRAAFAVKDLGSPLGLDGMQLQMLHPARPLDQGPRLEQAGQVGDLLARQQLGLLALACGAARHALDRARNYAGTRTQGGRTIAAWPAVQILLGEAASAIETTGRMLADLRSEDLQPDRIMLLRAALHPGLLRAAQQAVQVHGGSGYMRDTGVENRLRDVVHLGLLDGSGEDLFRFAAAWRGETGECSESEASPELAARHPLRPWQAFGSLRRGGRLASRYRPVDLDALDSARLPRVLRRLRRHWRDFAQRELAPLAAELDAAPHPPPGTLPPAGQQLLIRAARAGLLSDTLPWPLGRAPLRVAAVPLAFAQTVRAEELAAACGGQALLLSAHHLGLAPILLSGDLAAVRRFVLPAFRAHRRGDPHLFAFAITEPAAGSDVEDSEGAAQLRPGTTARRVEGGWRLSGRKTFISGGDLARSVTVFAALEGEGLESWTCFVIERDMPGFSTIRTELKMGQRASPAAELAFDEVFVPDSHVIGGLRQGWALNRAVLNYSRIPVGGLALGMARGAVEAVETRLVQDHRLGDQAVRLALADMWADLAAERALLWHYARAFVPRQATASVGKFHASDTAVRICERALELLGPAGIAPGPVEKAFRDVRLTQIYEGTNQINRLSVYEDLAHRFEPEKDLSP